MGVGELLRDGVLVGAGGFFGAVARFLVTGWIHARAAHFPYGTLAVNVIGSLAIGFLVTALAERVFAGSSFRLLAMVGFLGAFTTFSAFSYESTLLWNDGRWLALFSNIGLNVGGCFLATTAGVLAARAVTA